MFQKEYSRACPFYRVSEHGGITAFEVSIRREIIHSCRENAY